MHYVAAYQAQRCYEGVTGGLAAPAIGAGLSALGGTLGLGGLTAGIGGFLTTTGGTIFATSLFGATGAGKSSR